MIKEAKIILKDIETTIDPYYDIFIRSIKVNVGIFMSLFILLNVLLVSTGNHKQLAKQYETNSKFKHTLKAILKD